MMNKKLIKIISIIFIMPIAVYFLFAVAGEEPEKAWFWAIVVGIGSLNLFIFSPHHNILAGLKTLNFFDWLATIVIPVFFFFFIPDSKLITRLIKSLCIFWMAIGSEMWGNRFMTWIHKKIKKGQ